MRKDIAHLNIIGFRAAVAALEEPSLRGRPYVITGGTGGRTVIWDVSPEALRQNVRPGMALAQAERRIKDLLVVAPNPAACQKANSVIETVINRYAPVWQNDGTGNIFLDITGTRRIFGPPTDCVCRVQHEILDSLGIKAAAATATNKLVSKVASRAIRPAGLIEVRPGYEAAFLSRQNITLLPGMGPSLLKTVAATGFREIGEIAALSDREALALFGKKGPELRDAARGIDNSPVAGTWSRSIERQGDFAEDVIDETLIRGALASLAGSGGLEMRKDKLGARSLAIAARYSDGLEVSGLEKEKHLLVLDSGILAAAERLWKKTVTRRIRIRSIRLSLTGLAPLGYEPDLFEIESCVREQRLQKAIDNIQERYGTGKLSRALVLCSKSQESFASQTGKTTKKLTCCPAAYG